jgi:hypothetical protein
MKLTSLSLIAALVASVCAQAQTQPPEEGRRGRGANTEFAQACKAEIQQLCKGQRDQQAEQCLRNNESKLGSECKGALSRGRRR